MLLLKGERIEGGERGSDAYRDLLESEGFQVDLVPVLQFSHVNTSLVAPMLNSPETFSIVLTSPRAVTALSQALEKTPAANLNWKANKVFCVGPGTAKAIQVLKLEKNRILIHESNSCRTCLACLRLEKILEVQWL